MDSSSCNVNIFFVYSIYVFMFCLQQIYPISSRVNFVDDNVSDGNL